MAGGARGWVAGRAGLWGVRATWVWVVGVSPQILEHPTSICNTGVNVCYPSVQSGGRLPVALKLFKLHIVFAVVISLLLIFKFSCYDIHASG